MIIHTRTPHAGMRGLRTNNALRVSGIKAGTAAGAAGHSPAHTEKPCAPPPPRRFRETNFLHNAVPHPAAPGGTQRACRPCSRSLRCQIGLGELDRRLGSIGASTRGSEAAVFIGSMHWHVLSHRASGKESAGRSPSWLKKYSAESKCERLCG